MTIQNRIRLAGGLMLGVVAFTALAAPANAAWWGNNGWHDDDRWHHNDGRYYGYHYREPPIVYGNPYNYGYLPPPVIYDNTPGFTIHIR